MRGYSISCSVISCDSNHKSPGDIIFHRVKPKWYDKVLWRVPRYVMYPYPKLPTNIKINTMNWNFNHLYFHWKILKKLRF